MGGQERWEGRLEAVNTERTAKKGFVSGGHRCVRVCVCACACFTFFSFVCQWRKVKNNHSQS